MNESDRAAFYEAEEEYDARSPEVAGSCLRWGFLMFTLGHMKFTRGEPGEGYSALYKGPFDDKFSRLWLVTRAGDIGMEDPDGPNGRKWVGTDIRNEWQAIGRTIRFERDQKMTPEVAAAVYDILVEHARAPVREKDHFIHRQSNRNEPVIVEWRFCGVLGFGGKFWNDRDKWYVNAYPEDTTAEVRLVVARTDRALLDLFRRTYLAG